MVKRVKFDLWDYYEQQCELQLYVFAWLAAGVVLALVLCGVAGALLLVAFLLLR